jgi:glycosyltransferase involved in cell wall biosynthesis
MPTPPLKVLLMAYECSPYRGSEWAVGWGRLLEAAREFETHVITSRENFAALTQARSEGLLPSNVSFYTPEYDEDMRELAKKAVLFAYNYTAYHHWQQLALPLARELHTQHSFGVVHQVNVCTFREPGYTWQLGIPYLWGPVGGSQNFPVRFLSLLPPAEAFKEFMRGLSNWFALRKPRVRAAAKAAAMIVAANSTNQRDYGAVFKRPVELLLETGLRDLQEPDRTRFELRAAAARAGSTAAPLNILWSGELQSRKALPLLLRALASLPRNVAWRLRVLGDGPQRERWQQQAQQLGLMDRTEFLGRLPFADAVAQMQHADLFLFTSLRDTSGNVVLEAMAAGVPTVCFHHQGAGDMVDDASGVRLPVWSPKQAVQDFAAAIQALAADGERLLALSRGAHDRARHFDWRTNGAWINDAYRRLAGGPTHSTIDAETAAARSPMMKGA